VRSNYMTSGNTDFFEHSLKLWEGLSHELNFNVMLSQRGCSSAGRAPPATMRSPGAMRAPPIDMSFTCRAPSRSESGSG